MESNRISSTLVYCHISTFRKKYFSIKLYFIFGKLALANKYNHDLTSTSVILTKNLYKNLYHVDVFFLTLFAGKNFLINVSDPFCSFRPS